MSVVIPTWNREYLVGQAIDSVIGQRYEGPLEMIVVDDGSTDGTMRSLSARYAGGTLPSNRRLVLHSKPHTGISGTVGKGIELSTADHVSLCCSDDIWEPVRASELLAEVEKTPDALVHTNCKIRMKRGFRHPMHRNTDDALRLSGWPPLESPGNISLEEFLLHQHRKKRFFGSGLMVFPRRFLAGRFAMPEGLLNDDEWLAFAAIVQGEVRFVDRNSYVWRIHEQSESLPEMIAAREPARRKQLFLEHVMLALRSHSCRDAALLRRLATQARLLKSRARLLEYRLNVDRGVSLAQALRGISISDLLTEPREVLSYTLRVKAPRLYGLLRGIRLRQRLARKRSVR